ncbi:peroxisome biogenesis protein 22-like [Macadamia integrifolia]|uniref:peroxisome biogenesis protein 22-like n=1 Tax=Macadamia integrifolia TaxID=60698 RepID=UPI001C4E53EF|nr:peroxisome biogenesis protein 22-like [Macadamia integrifolia]
MSTQMSDSLAQQVMNLLKRLGKQFNRKVAEIVLILVNHKSAGSLGALAGFAIAIIFSWKFLRSTGRPQRRQQKPTGPASTSSTRANEDVSSYEARRLEQSVEGVDLIEFQSPTKPTLGQTVRKKLDGSRKMTCQLLGVILEERSPEELQEHATVRPSVVEVLLEISKYCDIYLMDRILDDESEERVLSALENAGLFRTGALMKDKLLFCSTDNGRSSFVRQLEPDWHIDTNPDIISQLSRFIRYQLYISPIRLSIERSNVFCSGSFDSFFVE